MDLYIEQETSGPTVFQCCSIGRNICATRKKRNTGFRKDSENKSKMTQNGVTGKIKDVAIVNYWTAEVMERWVFKMI